MGTARTWRARLASAPGNGIGAAGMAFNVALMPLKAVSGPWDEALGAPNVGTASIVAEAVRYAADHGAKRHQHEPRIPGRGRARARRHHLRRGQRRGRGRRRPATAETRAARQFWPGGLRAVNRRADGGAAPSTTTSIAPRTRTATRTSRWRRPAGTSTRTPTATDTLTACCRRRSTSISVDQGIFNQFAYFFFQGTSQATPHVSGLAALLMSQGVTDAKGSRGGHRTLCDRRRSRRPRQRHRLRRHQPPWRHATASAWPNRGAS